MSETMSTAGETASDLNPDMLTIAALTGTVWRFMTPESVVLAPYLQLLGTGRIGNYFHSNEHAWEVRDGRVVFLDDVDRLASVFTEAEVNGDGFLRLTGRFRDGSGVVLQQIAPLEGIAQPSDGVRLIRNTASPRRRNLVVIRANENSLHKGWQQDISDEDRSWDLCVSFYGKAELFARDAYAEYQVLQNVRNKYDSLWELMHVGSPLWDYEYITFPDDDLEMKWSDLNTLFVVCKEYNLSLAQPSLLPQGVINWNETRQNRNFKLRFVSMVEAMMPVFSRQALEACIPTFQLNPTGYGVDYAWSRLVGTPYTKIAVVDKIGVLHTRWTGKYYDQEAAIAEGRKVASRFGFWDHFWVKEYGGIYVESIKRWPDWR